jgi:hypothetical protein
MNTRQRRAAIATGSSSMESFHLTYLKEQRQSALKDRATSAQQMADGELSTENDALEYWTGAIAYLDREIARIEKRQAKS